MTADPLRELLAPGDRPTEVRPVLNRRGTWDLALIVATGYSHHDEAEDEAGRYAARLIAHGLPATAPERTTTA